MNRKFKANNQVHEIEEGFEHLLPSDAALITDEEAAEMSAPLIPTAQEMEDAKDAQADEIIKAFALVVLGEINILRVQAGLSERTVQQLKNAVKGKL